MDKREDKLTASEGVNVISLFGDPTKKSASAEKAENDAKDEDLDFLAVMKRNAENKKRMKDDRKKANQSVIRSYRLKK